MLGILKFQTFLLVVLLFICSCTYLHGVFPTWLDRNKTGYGVQGIVLNATKLMITAQTSQYFLACSPRRRAAQPICQSMLYSDGGKLIHPIPSSRTQLIRTFR